MPSRRSLLALPAAVLVSSGLAACGPNMPSGSGGGAGGASDEGSLRFAWWGNAVRDDLTREAISTYAKETPDLAIAGEPTDWTGYWDKLATQVAGGEVPDILQMDEAYLSEYSSRGILLDLGDTAIDTAEFESSAVDAGKVDGRLFALNAGVNAPVLLANPEVFRAAGAEMPDDSTWTWDDLLETSAAITKATPDGTYGVQQLGAAGDPSLSVYLRQLGVEKFDGEGLGFSADHLEQWMDYSLRLQSSKASPGASLAVEETGKAVDQTLFATGKCALASAWSNQVVSNDQALDGAVKVLRLPSMTGSARDVQLWYKASMYFCASARSSQQSAATAFLDWLVNSPDAGRILVAERGVPANLSVREEIRGDLSGADLKAVDFIESIADELGDPPPITPPGGTAVSDALGRHMEDVLFGRTSPPEASEAAVTEAAGQLG
ncbi:sugar ABC transporter substrate-binding protein [Brachybacterium endophyticum]|uniref:Sugar ABC transporter substrate-binding protein n=1 Tax=Brachybacterium endophyticum TaxID=2182385 RepID=A0A2U2RK42_9MICO|nr:extracellular solute-binding protein [Brachybacterium endophyticum]PWH06249.1 sugar ABC transporter substrate-binding protein [Brachybacterium endophyticum]